MRRLLSSALAVAVLTLASGCVVASPDADTYEDAAASSVGSVGSEVATVQMLLDLLDRHRITRPAVVTQLRYSEKNLATAAQDLTGLNAPREEDSVSSKAGDLFDQAETLVENARTAVHRSDTADYASIARDLKSLGTKLEKLKGEGLVKKVFALALGVLTAIGGFVDIGDLVTNGLVGARFGMSLSWVVVVGVIGIIVFAEMSGRVVAVSGRPTFDIVRERLGPRIGLLNLAGSMAVTFLTYIAEIGGVALSLELATSVNELLWIPVTAGAVWIVLWKAKFSVLENVAGLLGLSLIVFSVALWQLGPDWSELLSSALRADKPAGEEWSTYAYFVVALFGAAMTPYEVFFFSSGGIEEKWDASSIRTMRANVFVGFPLGGLLSLSIAAVSTVVFLPAGIQVESLGQVALPVAVSLGKIGLAFAILGFFAATFGAACETGLSVGYSIAQYFGWQWGKFVRPFEAARFHVVILIATVLAGIVLLTTMDPVLVTEFSVVFSAIALPLTYLPILVVANDGGYMGEHRNGALANTLGSIYMVLVVIASAAAIPLMIWTKMGTS